MTTTLANRTTTPLPITREVFGDERIEVLKEQLGRGWKEPMTDAELEHIALVCQETRLNPLVKPPLIYFIKRWDSRLKREVMTPQVSIDGLRLIAQRSRDYAGQIGPLWTADGKSWTSVWLEEEPPKAAKVGINRRGFREAIWAVATWQEWAQYQDEFDSRGNRTGRKVLAQFWATKPAHMLGKTAEGMAIKRAFAQETNKLELAAQHEEFLAAAPALAKRYEEIYGADEEHSAYELPKPRTIEHAGRTVDEDTGEVLDETPGQDPPFEVEHESQETPDEPIDEVRRVAVEANEELVDQAFDLGVKGLRALKAAADWPLNKILEANAELEARIRTRNGDLDRQAAAASGQPML